MGGYEEAIRHAQEIAEIQKKKRMEGKDPSCPKHDKNDPLERKFRKLRKTLKTERTKELKRHPERKILDVAERHRQPIQCVETGKIFHTLKELSKFLKLTPATVSIQVSRKRKLKGNTYIRISKEDEENGRRKKV